MNRFTVAAYYKGIPPQNRNIEKQLILDNFLLGVRTVGDIAVAHQQFNPIACDVALIQGYVHSHGKDAPHLRLRQAAIDLQHQNKKRALIVDSSLFLYVNNTNPHHYLRYSFDGVFPTTGFYFDKDVDPDRWKKISLNLNINMKPYRTQGEHVLICLQRNGGWSMTGLNVIDWLDATIKKIKQFSNRHIIVRPHPGDKKIMSILKIKYKNVSLSNNLNLIEDLRNAWATVVYNSSPSVASIIEGVPSFVTDPEPKHSQSCAVANTELHHIENPILPERQHWLERLAMCHWNFAELKSGEAWNFLRKYI
jgi:hypothetical protein